MKRTLVLMAAAGLFSAIPVISANEDKVTICHIPPENPANAHEITVGASAVPAHLDHGDTLGACGTGE
jgi:hypothetical protein